jgi:hypothetical protein
LVIRYAYVSSIPHLDPEDVASIPVVRLREEMENAIADKAEKAAQCQAEADIQENVIANEADRLITQFSSGDTSMWEI